MKIFDEIGRYISYALMGLMSFIVIMATLEVGYVILMSALDPPGFFLGVADLYDLFGLFLMVLIGLELLHAIREFVQKHTIHAEIMMLVAITAIARKIVIMDAEATEPLAYLAVGFVALALTAGYFLIRRSRKAPDV